MASCEESYPKINGIRYINKIKVWIHPHNGVTNENSSVFQY